jgi:hypothetical protein
LRPEVDLTAQLRAGLQSLPPLPPPPPQGPATFHLRDGFVAVAFVRFPDRWTVVDLPGFARPRPPQPPAFADDLKLVVRGRSDDVLWSVPVATSPADVADREIPELVDGEVPWFADATAVELRHGERVLVQTPVADPPSLTVEFPPTDELEHGRGTLSYRAESSSERLAVAIRASDDGGATWGAIVTREPAGKVDVGPLLRGSGDECLLEVLATSGYHTATEGTERFRVRARQRTILAWSSAEDGRVRRGESVQLLGVAEDGAAPASELSWYSDLDGELGRGARLATTLTPGHHRLDVRGRAPFERPGRLELDVE